MLKQLKKAYFDIKEVRVMLQKENPVRNKKYRDWVKKLSCCLCFAPSDDPHHIIGVGEGGTGITACDLLTMPVCRRCHGLFHRLDQNPELKDEQWRFVAKTLQKAIKDGIIKEITE